MVGFATGPLIPLGRWSAEGDVWRRASVVGGVAGRTGPATFCRSTFSVKTEIEPYGKCDPLRAGHSLSWLRPARRRPSLESDA